MIYLMVLFTVTLSDP